MDKQKHMYRHIEYEYICTEIMEDINKLVTVAVVSERDEKKVSLKVLTSTIIF